MIDFDYSEWAILRFIGASFVLWLCYYLLFDRKAPFNPMPELFAVFGVVGRGSIGVAYSGLPGRGGETGKNGTNSGGAGSANG